MRTNDPVRDAERYFSDLEDMPRQTYTARITMIIEVKCQGTCPEDAKEDAECMADYLEADLNNMNQIIDASYDSIEIEED